MRVFSDLDGTYLDHPEIWGQVEAIVTGNSWQQMEKVMNDWVGPKQPIFFNPQDKEELTLLGIVNHKAEVLNRCKVDKYFEDNPEAVSMLKLLCPNTKIILVKGQRTFI
jgi:hypothetical protein